MTELAGEVLRALAIAAVAIIGTGRLVRLLVFDDFPPVVWLRARWDSATAESSWNSLLHCGFCAGPWLLAICAAWGWASGFHWSWWVFFGWLAGSYLVSILVAWDQPPDSS